MDKALRNAAIQRAQAREEFAQSAENRRRGPERELTQAKRVDGGGGMRQACARKDKSKVDAHRARTGATLQ